MILHKQFGNYVSIQGIITQGLYKHLNIVAKFAGKF